MSRRALHAPRAARIREEGDFRSLTRMMKKMSAVAALGAAVVTLTACNTVKGLGRDIESVGEAGDRAT
jgi:predicted small secreted protein